MIFKAFGNKKITPSFRFVNSIKNANIYSDQNLITKYNNNFTYIKKFISNSILPRQKKIYLQLSQTNILKSMIFNLKEIFLLLNSLLILLA